MPVAAAAKGRAGVVQHVQILEGVGQARGGVRLEDAVGSSARHAAGDAAGGRGVEHARVCLRQRLQELVVALRGGEQAHVLQVRRRRLVRVHPPSGGRRRRRGFALLLQLLLLLLLLQMRVLVRVAVRVRVLVRVLLMLRV